MRLGRGRPVGAFGDDLGLDDRRNLQGDLVLERRGHQHVDVETEQLLVARIGSPPGKPSIVLCCFAQPASPGDVQTGGVVETTLPVGHRDNLRACSQARQTNRRCRIPGPHGGAVDVEAEVLGSLARHDYDAPAVASAAAQPSRPFRFGLAGDAAVAVYPRCTLWVMDTYSVPRVYGDGGRHRQANRNGRLAGPPRSHRPGRHDRDARGCQAPRPRHQQRHRRGPGVRQRRFGLCRPAGEDRREGCRGD